MTKSTPDLQGKAVRIPQEKRDCPVHHLLKLRAKQHLELASSFNFEHASHGPCRPVSRKAGTWLDTKPSAPTSPACLSEGDARALRYLSEAMVERWSGKETPENFCFRKPHFCYVTLSCLFWIRLKFSLFRAYFLDFTCCLFFNLKT